MLFFFLGLHSCKSAAKLLEDSSGRRSGWNDATFTSGDDLFSIDVMICGGGTCYGAGGSLSTFDYSASCGGSGSTSACFSASGVEFSGGGAGSSDGGTASPDGGARGCSSLGFGGSDAVGIGSAGGAASVSGGYSKYFLS